MKKMRVVLEIDVDDLPQAEREEAALDMEVSVSEIEKLEEVDALRAAEPLENISPETCRELFAGTDTYVTYMNVHVVSAEYI